MKNGAFTIEDMKRIEREDMLRSVQIREIVPAGRIPVFKFGQRCHPGAGLSVEYAQGTIAILCHACGLQMCSVAVAP
jgi:hypothetical protein